MSLKITNANGFKQQGVLNPSLTEIYVRPLVNQIQQQLLNETQMQIYTEAKTTAEYDFFAKNIQIDGMNPIYWTAYNLDANDLNESYYQIHLNLKEQIEQQNPDWVGKIEIVGIPIIE